MNRRIEEATSMGKQLTRQERIRAVMKSLDEEVAPVFGGVLAEIQIMY